jgi:cell cycle checkpoint protein
MLEEIFEIFVSSLEDNGVITECNINTLEAEEIVNFDFDFDTVVNKIIMKSECLREIISDIDVTNELIEIIICAEKEFIRFSSFGLIGDLHVI